MKLYNQRRVSISFDSAGHDYRWEPYGSCEVPDSLLPHMKACGFPVSVTPVPPEAKAAAIADEASAAQRGDELERLKNVAALASAEAVAAKAAAEESAVKVTSLLGKLESAEIEKLKHAARAEALDLDRFAAENLLSETAKKLETAEAEATRQTQRAESLDLSRFAAEARAGAAETERDALKAELDKLSADKKPKK